MNKIWGLFFLIVLSALTSAQTVEFRVDMGVQAYKGLFNPATDIVKIAGNFNGWNNGSDALTALDGDTIYTITKTFALDEELVFRFIVGNEGWEFDLNRIYKVPLGYSVYSAFFNNDSAYLKGSVTITFACNMEVELISGRFNSLTDTLSIRGSFNNWSDEWIMSPTIDTNIYEITKTIETYSKEVFHYKFAYRTNSEIVWQNDPIKTFIVTDSQVITGTAYLDYGGFNAEDLSPTYHTYYPFMIKFIVDMNNCVSAYNQQPFTSISTVRLAGVFNSYCDTYPYWCYPEANWPDRDSSKTVLLYDDGTNGDNIPHDNIWSSDISFPYWPLLAIHYKYAANWALPSNGGGNNNESITDDHRILYIPPNILKASIIDTFGIMGINEFTNLLVADIEDKYSYQISNYSLEQNYPNPFNPSTKIRYTIPLLGGDERGGFVTLKVYDILGNEVATLVDEFKTAGSYEVEFNANSGTKNLASGIYFYQLKVSDASARTGQSFIQTKKMIFLK